MVVPMVPLVGSNGGPPDDPYGGGSDISLPNLEDDINMIDILDNISNLNKE